MNSNVCHPGYAIEGLIIIIVESTQGARGRHNNNMTTKPFVWTWSIQVFNYASIYIKEFICKASSMKIKVFNTLNIKEFIYMYGSSIYLRDKIAPLLTVWGLYTITLKEFSKPISTDVIMELHRQTGSLEEPISILHIFDIT